MAIGTSIRQVRILFDVGTMVGLADSELLERFLMRDGEAAELAFTVLIERHGPMVMRVSRGVLGDSGDVLDAFQSTFLVLATRAKSVRRRESLGSWLHGVALRVARFAHASRVRREVNERRWAAQSPTHYELESADSRSIVFEEFSRLPDRYHAPMVLCDLEDFTHQQAATQLGWPVGTVKSRLSRGRAQLRERLIRRGLSRGAIPMVHFPTLPPSIVDSLARTASRMTLGKIQVGMVPASIEALLQGVQRMMIRETLRNGWIAIVAFGTIATGLAMGYEAPEHPEVKPTSFAPDPTKVQNRRMVTAETHFIEMKGIDWINTVEPKLKLVKKTPSFKVWTTEVNLLKALQKEMKVELQAPKITLDEGSLAHVFNTTKQEYVGGGEWKFNHDGSAVAFHPKVMELENGIKVNLSARKLDQGMLVQISIDDQRLLGLATQALTAQLKNGDRITIPIQIPERCSLQETGEWLVPNGGLLILSLGRSHTETAIKKTGMILLDELLDEVGFYQYVADKNYWSSPVTERLVVIDTKLFIEPIKAAPPHKISSLPNLLPGYITTQGLSRP